MVSVPLNNGNANMLQHTAHTAAQREPESQAVLPMAQVNPCCQFEEGSG